METIIFLSFIVVILLGVFFLFKHYEQIICVEICNIYCNAIVAFDQFVGEAIEIGNEWQKFVLKITLNGKIESNMVDQVLQMLEMKKRHIAEMYSLIPKFTYQSSVLKQIVLNKHKLPLQEIELATTMPTSTYNDLNAIIDDAILKVKANDIDQLQLSFVQTQFKTFEFETFGMFYGALEGICTFPSRALDIYNEVANQIKYLPKSVGCRKRKEDYLHFQEIEMNKVQSVLESYGDLLKEAKNMTIEYTDVLLKHDANMFFSGSKQLETERNIFNGVVIRQQTRWRDKDINIMGYSYQNFPHEVVKEGHQAKYNDFIQHHTDAIFFVLNGNVGGYTQEEFDLAMESFNKTGKPMIFVYSKVSDSVDVSVDTLRKVIIQQKQYWQDYKNNDELKLLLENDMYGVIVGICDENDKIRRTILE